MMRGIGSWKEAFKKETKKKLMFNGTISGISRLTYFLGGLLRENVSLGLNQIARCCVYSVCVCKGRYHEKRCCSFGFCPNYFPAAPPPSPQFGQLVQLFS